jgi:hypothetical protein
MERTGANPVSLALMAVLVVSSACGAAHAQSDETAALDRRVVELFGACKPAEAIPLAKQSLELREKALPADDPAIVVNLQVLALLYVAQGLAAEAEPLLKRVEAYEKKLPAGSPTLAKALDNLATLCLSQWRLGETEALLKLSLVSASIAIYPATSSSEKVRFNTLNRATGNRLKRKMVDAVTRYWGVDVGAVSNSTRRKRFSPPTQTSLVLVREWSRAPY